jgi:hypothetical protein
MGLDADSARLALDVLQCLGLVALWLRKPGQDATERVTRVEAQLGVLQEQIKHVPSSAELATLEGSLRSAVTDIDNVRDLVLSVRTTVNRIDDFLRENR